jgi:hypothetical protein
MCGAILGTLAAELTLGEQEQAMVIDAQFTCDGQVVDASFFMFPGEQMIDMLGPKSKREAAPV